MEINIFNLSKLRTPGETYNSLNCFNARDMHFICMDQYKNKGEENHYRCSQSFSEWRNQCDPALWRIQLEERDHDQRDRFLYTKEQLKDYNRRKNDFSGQYDAQKFFRKGK